MAKEEKQFLSPVQGKFSPDNEGRLVRGGSSSKVPTDLLG